MGTYARFLQGGSLVDIAAAQLAAAIVTTGSTYFRLPTSTIQIYAFSLLGVGLVAGLPVSGSAFGLLIVGWIAGPLVAFVLGFLLARLGSSIATRGEATLRGFLVAVAAYSAFVLGSNDVSNAASSLVGANLLPPRLAALYGGVICLRGGLYRAGVLRSVRLSVPVIVIGNLSVGGTGKTPLTIAVVAALRARGYRPGVVSRGYGGSQREPLLLGDAPDPAQVGDEPCLIHAGGVPVAVGRDRPAAAQLLLDAGCNVLVADDGLQHYRLARDVEICVIDARWRTCW